MFGIKLLSFDKEANLKMKIYLQELLGKNSFSATLFFIFAALLFSFLFWLMSKKFFIKAFLIILLLGIIYFIFSTIGAYWCLLNEINLQFKFLGFSPIVLWICFYKFLSAVSWDKYFIYGGTALLTYMGTSFILKSQKSNK